MANIDCSSCEELREKSIDFATHGVTDAVCNSLKNDTGFSTKNSNNDCEDLDNANDCLIGMQENEIEKYEACDWQKFMHKFIPNLHQLLKAMICAICGIWTNIHSLWKHMNQAEKDIDNLEGRMDVAEKDIDNLQDDMGALADTVDGMCELLGHNIAPPLADYAVLPLSTTRTSVGHATNKVRFMADDGALNPYTKGSQGIGISYAKLETTDCATGQCTVYEWIQPKIYMTYIKEGTTVGDVLWYCKKSELQEACGFTDRLWRTFTESSWTWNDGMINNGSSYGKFARLQITVNPGNMGDDYIGVTYNATTYPGEWTVGYDEIISPLGNVPRLYTHRCGAV